LPPLSSPKDGPLYNMPGTRAPLQSITCTPQEEDTFHQSRREAVTGLGFPPSCLIDKVSHRPIIHRLQRDLLCLVPSRAALVPAAARLSCNQATMDTVSPARTRVHYCFRETYVLCLARGQGQRNYETVTQPRRQIYRPRAYCRLASQPGCSAAS
jgi:hypothetical protein